nr:MAG TPA: minor tail protein [Caudoviricetes sp.]
MAADGSIRVETKLDTKGFEKGLEDVDTMCNGTKKHLESIAESLNIKTNPIEITNNSQLAKAKKKLEEINAEVKKIQAQTDELLPKAETEEQVVNLLKLEEEQTKNLVAEQNNLNKAISEYEAKQEKIAAEKQQKELERQRQAEIKAAEKQQKDDIKSINSDVSGTVAGDDFVSKIKNAEQYEATLEKVKAKMQTIEQKTAKLAAKKGIDGSDALNANREYQKLKKQYDALIASADKFKRSSKSGFDKANSGAKKLGASMKSAVKSMAKYTLAIFGAQAGFYAIKNAIRQVLSDNEELNNTVTAMKGAFANALAPIIERVVYWLKYAFAYLNLFVKVLTGVDMAAQYNAKAINKQTEATKKNAKATKEANAQLASFDEKNVQSANNLNAADTESESPATLLDLPDVSGGKFEQICENIKAHLNELMIIAGWAMIAIGLILLALGQYPMGIACLIAGIVLEAKALGNWSQLSEEAQKMISAIMGIAGTAFLALGIILCIAQQYPLGIALIVLGVAMIATAIALNWDGIKAKIEVVLDKIKQVILKSFLIVLGIMLLTTGVGMPLGIALIVEGIKAIRSEETLDWEAIKTHVEAALTRVKNIITGYLMMVVGVLLCCSGVGIPLGVGLIIEGVRAIKSDEALDWEKMKNEIQATMETVKMYLLNAGAIVVGILLCVTGVSLPLGLALILSGIKAFKTGETINSDLILNTVKDTWARIKAFWNAHIGYVFKKEWWSKKFDCIKQGMRNALNGVIDIVERTINNIVSKLNSFSIKIPNWVPTYGGSSLGFNIPYAHLTRLAKGGIVNNPGRGQAVIAGEAGAEAILPLQNNTEWMDMLVDKVADRVSMNVVNRITIDGKDVNSSNKKYDSRFAFATNGGVL